MSDDNDRGLFRDGLDGLLDEALGTGVQSTSGLIQDQEVWLSQDGPG